MSYLNKVNRNLTLRKFELSKILLIKGFPIGSAGKEFTNNAEDTGYDGLIPGLGRSPGEGNGNLLQHSCLKNPKDRGAWWAIVKRITESNTIKCIWTSLKKNNNNTQNQRSIIVMEENTIMCSYTPQNVCCSTFFLIIHIKH